MGRRRRRPGRRPFFSSYTVLCTRCGRGSNKASPLLSPRSRQCSVQQRRRRKKDADVHHQRKSRSTPFPFFPPPVENLSPFVFLLSLPVEERGRLPRDSTGKQGGETGGRRKEEQGETKSALPRPFRLVAFCLCAKKRRRRRRKEKGGSTHVRANERRASLPATSSSSFLPIFENRTFFLGRKGRRVGGGGGGKTWRRRGRGLNLFSAPL